MPRQLSFLAIVAFVLMVGSVSTEAISVPTGTSPGYPSGHSRARFQSSHGLESTDFSLTSLVPYHVLAGDTRMGRGRLPLLFVLSESSVPGVSQPWASRSELYPGTRTSVPGGGIAVVPEPATMILVGLGLTGMVMSRRRLR